MNLTELNQLSPDQRRRELERCCGSMRWNMLMGQRFPFQNKEELFAAAEEVWFKLLPNDWLEAFAHHPKIGDVDSLRAKFASTRHWAEGEQAGVSTASEEVLRALAEGNAQYENKFGYIFIVCATGKNAEEMLAILQARLPNDHVTELQIAAGEQNKITRIRLEKLLRE
jgi:2-oxo-4-hydroxy-4-carboxy-5-ureidoimidazoline decarboxylase